MPEEAKGTTETVRCTARLGEQRRLMPTPIPTDRVMQSDTCRMHTELPEVGMEAAQIVTRQFEQVEIGIREAELELEEERRMIEEDHQTFSREVAHLRDGSKTS